MRYLLRHPEHMQGQRELMRALTERPEFGIEFVERVDRNRVWIVVSLFALFGFLVALMWGIKMGDWVGGFSIGCECLARLCCN